MQASATTRRLLRQLASYFFRNGYMRVQNEGRLAKEGRRYKKGDEIRFAAQSRAELGVIRQLLRRAGFKPGKPFEKGKQYRLPVYGRKEVQRFLDLMKSLNPE